MMRRALLITILLTILAPLADAIQLERGKSYQHSTNQVQEDELWLVTDSADAAGIFRDDFFTFCAATATLTGTFEADVWALSDGIIFDGHAESHARFMGRSIRVNGIVEGSLAAAGTSVGLSPTAVVKKDAVLFGENVLVEGEVGGKLRIMAYSATVSGRVRGDLRIVADDIVIVPGTEIGGDLIYTASSDLALSDKVLLGGSLIKKDVEAGDLSAQPSIRQSFRLQLFLYVCAVIAALPFIGAFPNYTGRAVRILRQSSWKCSLTGLLTFCLVPMIALFALFTIIGIPLSLILFALYLILIYLSKVIVALVIGGIVMRRRGPQPFSRVFAALSFGLLMLYLLASIPMLSSFVWVATTLLGLGALTLALFGRDLPAATTPVIVPPPVPQDRHGTTPPGFTDETPMEKDRQNPTKE